MRKYVIASHGKMAEGLRSTLEIIIGPQENLICVNAYTDECGDPMPEFQRIIDETPDDEVVIMTDMLGGSVNNNAVVLAANPNVHVVTGTNLALAISILMSDQNDCTDEVIENAVRSAREMITDCSSVPVESEEDDF